MTSDAVVRWVSCPLRSPVQILQRYRDTLGYVAAVWTRRDRVGSGGVRT